jgi:hypothetical protein
MLIQKLRSLGFTEEQFKIILQTTISGNQKLCLQHIGSRKSIEVPIENNISSPYQGLIKLASIKAQELFLMELEESARKYPCIKCGKLRTKDEGGTTFTVCDGCWDTK